MKKFCRAGYTCNVSQGWYYKMNIHPVTKYSISLVFFLLAQMQPAGAQSRDKCEAMSGYDITDINIQITRTEWRKDFTPAPQPPFGPPVTEIMPPHCHIEGEIDNRTGHDGKPYAIGFAVNLPADWNGRFFFAGGAGLNGTLWDPLGIRASAGKPALLRGFAVASTDSGHKGIVFDSSFVSDQEALLNFYYLANGRVTVVAKKLVREFYGKAAEHSYFVGCSTGGREGMIMSQRYPYYYDGIVVGAPAMRTGFSNLALKWISVSLNQVAQSDEAGKIVPRSAFTEGQRRAIMDSLKETCDANDGIADGLISDTIGCKFDPKALVCNKEENDTCISRQQADALMLAFSGPKDSSGENVYPGFWFDTGINTRMGIPGLLMGGTSPVDAAGATATVMDVDAEARAAAVQQSSLGDATWTNLTSFSGNGGKLIFYHGVSDAWFSAQDTIGYYEQMSAVNGGIDVVRNWSRAFLVPGMLHCDGGESMDNFDMIEAIVNWVEKDQPPESVIATGRAIPGRSRPLCPYPEHAHYKGSGNTEDASNFECR